MSEPEQAPEVSAMTPWEFGEPIRTDRLILRMMTVDDVDDVHAWMSDPEVTRYLLHDPRDRDDVATRVADYSLARTLASTGDYVQLAVELPGDRVIGSIYFTIASADDSTGELGWAFNSAFHGKGYAYEAASAVMNLAFGPVGLHRVFADLDPRNSASIALCERLGMRHEAHFVEHMWVKGEWADTGIYGILAREWNART
jgi:RimJ/RimL family protein N-acetyltransferase